MKTRQGPDILARERPLAGELIAGRSIPASIPSGKNRRQPIAEDGRATTCLGAITLANFVAVRIGHRVLGLEQYAFRWDHPNEFPALDSMTSKARAACV